MTPKLCHRTRASSGTCSLFLLNSIKAPSLLAGSINSATHCKTLRFSSDSCWSMPGEPCSFMLVSEAPNVAGALSPEDCRLLFCECDWLMAIRL